MFRTRKALLAGAALAVLATHAAQAQDADNAAAGQPMAAEDLPLVTQLDQVTVVSRTGESPIDQMASVSHVGPEELERRMATTPSQMLFGVPGITMQSDAKRVASGINIRGLQDFGRVAVILDGARQNFQISGHGTQSMVFIDPLLVEQIDVIRGPSANTYGSGAIGGVVAFETKDASDFLRPGEKMAGSLTGIYETNGQGWTTSAIGAIRFNDVTDIIANVVWRDYGEYKDGNGDRMPGTGFDVLSGLVKSTIHLTENSDLRLGWIGAKDSWVSANGDDQFDTRQNTFTARYNISDPALTWLDLHINTSLNIDDVDKTEIASGDTTNYLLKTYGLDIWNTSRFETGAFSHEATYGGDWVLDDIDVSGSADPFTPSGKRQIWGAYIQDKIGYEWLEVIAGLRYDNFRLKGGNIDNSGDHLSPRLTVGVSPFQGDALGGLQFYGTYAEGYRSPSTSETFIDGLHPGSIPMLSNPNLIPETGKTWEAGINYKRDDLIRSGDNLRLKAAYFNSNIDDYIDLAVLFAGANPICTPPVPGFMCFQYQNFDKARIQGVELEAAYDAGRYFGGLNVSIIDGYRIDDGVRGDLVNRPSSQVTGTIGFRFLDNKLTIGGEVQYNDVPSSAAYPKDYTLVNVFANYQATDSLNFDFRVNNLLDVTYANALTDPNAFVYEPGVTFKLAATMRWGG